jgi:hypothetical protein
MTQVPKAMLLKQLPVDTIVNLYVEGTSQRLEGLRIHVNSRTRLGFQNKQESCAWTLNKDAYVFSWSGTQLLIYRKQGLPAYGGGTHYPLCYRLSFPEFINWYKVLPDV